MHPDQLWLVWGLSGNPFAETVADRQAELEAVYIEPPYFRELLGAAGRPAPALVFGYRGEGKTALRKMIRFTLDQERVGRGSFVVDHTDFSEWSYDSAGESTLERHLARLIERATDQFLTIAAADFEVARLLGQDKRRQTLELLALQYLAGRGYHDVERRLVAAYELADRDQPRTRRADLSRRAYGVTSWLRQMQAVQQAGLGSDVMAVKLLYAAAALVAPLPASEQAPDSAGLHLWRALVNLIRACGFESVYVLVDGLDEAERFSVDYAAVTQLVRPLLTSLRFLEMPGVAVKLFVPMQVRDLIGPLRTDRITTKVIAWTREGLERFTAKRLRAFSGDRIGNFGRIVASEEYHYFEETLYYYAAGSPRNLIRIISEIVAELCELEDQPTLITRAAIEQGKRRFLSVRSREDDARDYDRRLFEAGEAPGPR